MSNSTRQQRRIALIGGFTAVVALASCSSPVGGGGDEGASGNGTGAGGQTLTVTAFDSVDVKVLKEVGKVFESQHKGWKVSVTQIPQDNYVTKTRLSVKAGNPPDIAYVYAIGEIANFQPLTDVLYKKHNLDPSDFNEATLKYSCGYKEELYCIGGYSGSEALYYNKAMFKKAGVPFPSASEPMTFAEYAALAKKLTHKSAGKVVWGGDAERPTYYVDPGIFMDDAGKKAELTNPDYVKTWTILTDMVLHKDAPSPDDLSGTSSKDMFAKGRMAMVISDNFAVAKMEAGHIDWGVAPVPVQPGDKPWVNVWTNAYGITKGAKHTAEAADFLALLGTKPGQQAEAKEGLMPLNTKYARSMFGSKSPSNAQLVDVSKLARLGTFTPNLYNWLAPLDDAWTATASGRKSVKEALSEAQPKAQQGLDATWTTWNDTIAAIK